MDTDMIRHLDVPKSDPALIAKLAIDAIEAGDAEIIADETSRRILARLSAGIAGLYPPGRLTRPAKELLGRPAQQAQLARLQELGLNTDSDLERSLGRRVVETRPA